jgi:hypothetical protein
MNHVYKDKQGVIFTISSATAMPAPRLESLSRTSSVTSTGTSTSSDDLYATFINESTDATTRRTRKRFTNAQLMMLEQLFHQNSHPSREQRESVARSANMFVSRLPPSRRV